MASCGGRVLTMEAKKAGNGKTSIPDWEAGVQPLGIRQLRISDTLDG